MKKFFSSFLVSVLLLGTLPIAQAADRQRRRRPVLETYVSEHLRIQADLPKDWIIEEDPFSIFYENVDVSGQIYVVPKEENESLNDFIASFESTLGDATLFFHPLSRRKRRTRIADRKRASLKRYGYTNDVSQEGFAEIVYYEDDDRYLAMTFFMLKARHRYYRRSIRRMIRKLKILDDVQETGLTRYSNAGRGLDITYPEGWTLQRLPDGLTFLLLPQGGSPTPLSPSLFMGRSSIEDIVASAGSPQTGVELRIKETLRDRGLPSLQIEGDFYSKRRGKNRWRSLLSYFIQDGVRMVQLHSYVLLDRRFMYEFVFTATEQDYEKYAWDIDRVMRSAVLSSP